MKAYLASTGILFGLMTVVHIWRAIEEWPHPAQLGVILGMAALVVVPASLTAWAWWCLRNLPADQNKKIQSAKSDDSAA